MRGRVGPEVWLLGVLLALFVFVSYRIVSQAPQQSEKGNPRRSSYSSQPAGWKAWYLLLRERGLVVDRWQRPPASWPKDARVVITGPNYIGMSGGFTVSYWSEQEAEDALAWVENGGTLFILTSEDNALTQALTLTPDDSPFVKDNSPLVPTQPAAFLVGVHQVIAPDKFRWQSTFGSAVPVLGDKKTAVVVLARGQGRIIAAASPALADNKHLADGDNARFVAQVVEAYAGAKGRVLFDEFHQGYSDSDSLWSAIGKPGQFVTYQLVALALLIAYSAGRRFGQARPVPAPPRVSSEYVTSLADLYRRARAGDAALEGVYLSFWRDLCRAASVPLDSEPADVASRAAAALADGRKDTAARLLAIIEACETKIAAGAKGIRDDDLLKLARDMEAMRKELKLGADSAG